MVRMLYAEDEPHTVLYAQVEPQTMFLMRESKQLTLQTEQIWTQRVKRHSPSKNVLKT